MDPRNRRSNNDEKQRWAPSAPASKPGAQQVQGKAAALLDQRINDKQHGRHADAGNKPAPQSLEQIEQDLYAKRQGRSQKPQATQPGVVPVATTPPKATSGSLTQLEQDIIAKKKASSSRSALQPGVVADAGFQSQKSTAGVSNAAAKSESLAQLEKDINAKKKASSSRAATQPGVVPVESSRMTTTTPTATSESLSKLEQDINAKKRASSSRVPAQPGVVPVENTRIPSGSLSQLEQDINAKKRASSSRSGSALQRLQDDATADTSTQPRASATPGAASGTVEQLEEDLAAKRHGVAPQAASVHAGSNETNRSPTRSLNRLEQDVNAKAHAGTPRAATKPGIVSTTTPGATSRTLEQLEEDLAVKRHGVRTHGTTQLAQLENGAHGVASTTSNTEEAYQSEVTITKQQQNFRTTESSNVTSPSLHDAEQIVMRKRGDNVVSDDTCGGVASKEMPKQNPKGLDDDLEFGVYGGQEEEGLAVAFAVAEEDGDAFIPAAIEYSPDAKPPLHKNRRFRLYSILAVVIVIVAVVGTSLGLTLGSSQKYVMPEELHYRSTLGIRENLEQVVGSDELDNVGSPYRIALDWIMFDDTMQVTPDFPNFTQRFILAYIYFSTFSDEKPWFACGRIDSSESSDCEYEYATDAGVGIVHVTGHHWMSSVNECLWVGVECNENQQVRSLVTEGLGMSGTIPEGISHLRFLQSLDMKYNSLTGSTPSSLANLNQLLDLQLQANELTGTISEEMYRNMSGLTRLNLSINKIEGSISTSIQHMKDLRAFFVHQNSMTGTLPTEIGLLNGIAYLSVGRNSLKGTIPIEFGNLNNLSVLSLFRNHFTGTIPSDIAVFGALDHLRLNGNFLTGTIPDILFTNPSISILDVSENQLTGTIPNDMSAMVRLAKLYVDGNELEGQIPSIGWENLSLVDVSFSNNDFKGTMPFGICEARRADLAFVALSADCGGVNPVVFCDDGCCSDCCNSVEEGYCSPERLSEDD